MLKFLPKQSNHGPIRSLAPEQKHLMVLIKLKCVLLGIEIAHTFGIVQC